VEILADLSRLLLILLEYRISEHMVLRDAAVFAILNFDFLYWLLLFRQRIDLLIFEILLHVVFNLLLRVDMGN